MAPPDQCLVAGRDPRRHLDAGLVVHLELVALHGAVHLVHQSQRHPGLASGGRHVELGAVAAPFLGPVHGGVGLADEPLGGAPRSGDRDADAHGRVEALTRRQLERCRDVDPHVLDHAAELELVDRREEQRELVATEAADQAVGSDGSLQSMCHLEQEVVTHLVAERVVDHLEPVQVDERDGRGPRRLVEQLLQVRGEAVSVDQAGEGVVGRQVLQSVHGPIGGAGQLGDLLVHPVLVGDDGDADGHEQDQRDQAEPLVHDHLGGDEHDGHDHRCIDDPPPRGGGRARGGGLVGDQHGQRQYEHRHGPTRHAHGMGMDRALHRGPRQHTIGHGVEPHADRHAPQERPAALVDGGQRQDPDDEDVERHERQPAVLRLGLRRRQAAHLRLEHEGPQPEDRDGGDDHPVGDAAPTPGPAESSERDGADADDAGGEPDQEERVRDRSTALAGDQHPRAHPEDLRRDGAGAEAGDRNPGP